jgi:hypothetical protein
MDAVDRSLSRDGASLPGQRVGASNSAQNGQAAAGLNPADGL